MSATAPFVPRPDGPPALRHAGLWLLALAAAHVLARVLVSPSLKWDEAEQIIWSQHLALGYGTQPPLYTWLQWAVNQLLGPSVLALSLLKHTLMALAYVFMYLAGREVLGPRGAWWAAAGMLLMPPLGWYSLRDQTHTVLVTTLTCAAWWLLLRGLRRPQPATFAWLGLVCGLGLLAKYNFALVAVAMGAAALSLPEGRRALRMQGGWLAPVLALLVVLPHAQWLLGHLPQATEGTVQRMDISAQPRWGRGLRELLDGLLATLGLWALVALGAFRAGWWRGPAQGAQAGQQSLVPPWLSPLLGRYLLLVLLALLGMVLAAGVSSFKGRWLLPLFCVVPLAAFALRPGLQYHPHGGRYTAAVVVAALVFWLAGGLRPLLGSSRGHVDGLHYPVRELAAALQAQGYDGRSPIIAADPVLAGILRTRFAQAPVGACSAHEGESPAQITTCVAAAQAQAAQAGLGWLLISRDTRLQPHWWPHALASRTEANAAAIVPQHIRLPYRTLLRTFPADVPPADYQYVWQPPAVAPSGAQR